MPPDLRIVTDDETPEQIAAERAAVPSWQNRLSRRKNGQLLRLSRNAELILLHDDRWAGKVAWDDFRQSIMFRGEPPWDPDVAPATPHTEWTDSDFIRLQGWLSRGYGLHLGREIAAGAVRVVAEKSFHHEVREYLDGLCWDGRFRVPFWASRYLGAAPGPYGELVSKLWLTSAAARIMSPGCKADAMVVLEGEQGARKSTALQVLFGDEWFSDTPLDLESKDRFVALRGCWCFEWAELDAARRVDIARIKSMLSSRYDKYRPPYGHCDVRVARQCVFAGTTNPQVYLRDETGNRRFWPIRCGRIDIPALVADRNQIWAEAMQRYESWRRATESGIPPSELSPDERWWPEGPEERALLEEEQDERVQLDPWDGLISDWLERSWLSPTVTTSDILSSCLQIEPGKRTRTDETRVGTILQRLKWERGRARIGGKRAYMYRRPGT